MTISKKTFLTKQVSTITKWKTLVKYKDLACLTIYIVNGESFYGKSSFGPWSKCQSLAIVSVKENQLGSIGKNKILSSH